MKRISINEKNEIVIYGSKAEAYCVIALFAVIGTVFMFAAFKLFAILDAITMGVR